MKNSLILSCLIGIILSCAIEKEQRTQVPFIGIVSKHRLPNSGGPSPIDSLFIEFNQSFYGTLAIKLNGETIFESGPIKPTTDYEWSQPIVVAKPPAKRNKPNILTIILNGKYKIEEVIYFDYPKLSILYDQKESHFSLYYTSLKN